MWFVDDQLLAQLANDRFLGRLLWLDVPGGPGPDPFLSKARPVIRTSGRPSGCGMIAATRSGRWSGAASP